MENSSMYTTDDKVKWYSTEEEINSKLSSIIGKKFEDYREKWDAANRFELETDFPLFLQVETHQICNLKCPSCPIGIPEAYDKYISSEKMDWDIYQKIILEGESYGCPSIEPQGTNEPFLDKNLIKRIEFCTSKGVPTYFSCTPATMTVEKAKKTNIPASVNAQGQGQTQPAQAQQ